MDGASTGAAHTTNVMGKVVSEEVWLHGMAALITASISGNATTFVIVADTS